VAQVVAKEERGRRGGAPAQRVGEKGRKGEEQKGRRAEGQKNGKPRGGETGTAERSKKRRFPFRKLSDIEAEIFQRESRIEQLNEELRDQATFRDGGRVRAIKQELAEQQSALKRLYEHWDEASEMNW
jgi:ATP-binding cassette subfamily F protein 3